eukprot:gnl/Dysnectes_brevis/3539_a4497_493.p1 GENE.gnl/Dysnectes_brevis/3539_a4497_493~~gnl/Dysnectes_brevis/3539_a4497_493.p1  ORF type:complete len:1273 (+),score=115.66 gnl/Dysnectes_brevis/3539_a4497_493:113-3931(+)
MLNIILNSLSFLVILVLIIILIYLLPGISGHRSNTEAATVKSHKHCTRAEQASLIVFSRQYRYLLYLVIGSLLLSLVISACHLLLYISNKGPDHMSHFMNIFIYCFIYNVRRIINLLIICTVFGFRILMLISHLKHAEDYLRHMATWWYVNTAVAVITLAFYYPSLVNAFTGTDYDTCAPDQSNSTATFAIIFTFCFADIFSIMSSKRDVQKTNELLRQGSSLLLQFREIEAWRLIKKDAKLQVDIKWLVMDFFMLIYMFMSIFFSELQMDYPSGIVYFATIVIIVATAFFYPIHHIPVRIEEAIANPVILYHFHRYAGIQGMHPVVDLARSLNDDYCVKNNRFKTLTPDAVRHQCLSTLCVLKGLSGHNGGYMGPRMLDMMLMLQQHSLAANRNPVSTSTKKTNPARRASASSKGDTCTDEVVVESFRCGDVSAPHPSLLSALFQALQPLWSAMLGSSHGGRLKMEVIRLNAQCGFTGFTGVKEQLIWQLGRQKCSTTVGRARNLHRPQQLSALRTLQDKLHTLTGNSSGDSGEQFQIVPVSRNTMVRSESTTAGHQDGGEFITVTDSIPVVDSQQQGVESQQRRPTDGVETTTSGVDGSAPVVYNSSGSTSGLVNTSGSTSGLVNTSGSTPVLVNIGGVYRDCSGSTPASAVVSPGTQLHSVIDVEVEESLEDESDRLLTHDLLSMSCSMPQLAINPIVPPVPMVSRNTSVRTQRSLPPLYITSPARTSFGARRTSGATSPITVAYGGYTSTSSLSSTGNQPPTSIHLDDVLSVVGSSDALPPCVSRMFLSPIHRLYLLVQNYRETTKAITQLKSRHQPSVALSSATISLRPLDPGSIPCPDEYRYSSSLQDPTDDLPTSSRCLLGEAPWNSEFNSKLKTFFRVFPLSDLSMPFEQLVACTEGHPLEAVLYESFLQLGIIERLHLEPTAIVSLFTLLVNGQPDHPFHNVRHTTECIHISSALFRVALERSQGLFHGIMTSVDAFSLLLAAAGHDVGHTGTDNLHLEQIGHPLSKRYPVSPLESASVSMCCQMVEASGIIDHFPGILKRRVHLYLTALILDTDLSTLPRIISDVNQHSKVSQHISAVSILRLIILLADNSFPFREQSIFKIKSESMMEENSHSPTSEPPIEGQSSFRPCCQSTSPDGCQHTTPCIPWQCIEGYSTLVSHKIFTLLSRYLDTILGLNTPSHFPSHIRDPSNLGSAVYSRDKVLSMDFSVESVSARASHSLLSAMNANFSHNILYAQEMVHAQIGLRSQTRVKHHIQGISFEL